MINLPKKLNSNYPPPKSTLFNHKIVSYLSLLLFIIVVSISLFICSSCAIPPTKYQDNQNNKIINYEIKSKETNIPTATETYSDNTVNWCIYSNKTLVINGPNTDNYKGYGTIITSGNDLDLNRNYSYESQPPWSNSRSNIQQVEFAEKTQPTSTAYWFYFCTKIKNINLENLDTQNVTDMRSMFDNCSSLTSLTGLSGWNTKNVTSMAFMFSGCSHITSLTGLSGWDTQNVTSMSRMFYGCSSLTSLDLSGWDTSQVTYMGEMFYGCSSLTSLTGLSGWNTKNVTSMYDIFWHCSSLTSLDLSGWDTQNVTSMNSMFNSCSSLKVLYLNNWKLKNKVLTCYMFCNCFQLEIIYCKNSWSCSDKFKNVTKYTTENMFYNCPLLHSDTTKENPISTKSTSSGVSYANPRDGLFTMPPVLGSFKPTIQKIIIDNNGNRISDFPFETEQFTFRISTTDDTPLPEGTDEIQTDETGKATWDRIDYDTPGEYIYEIAEISGEIPNITYDPEPHKIKVIVNNEDTILQN